LNTILSKIEIFSKERNSKERTKHAYIRTNGFFLSKQILKERQTNFERTLFDQTTYPAHITQKHCEMVIIFLQFSLKTQFTEKKLINTKASDCLHLNSSFNICEEMKYNRNDNKVCMFACWLAVSLSL
jgi:hypothetical protein